MDPDQSQGLRIEVTRDGPYRVHGGLPLREMWIVPDDDGASVGYRDGVIYDIPAEYDLCRCGRSANKPFCDESHCTQGFDGTETARRVPYLAQAKTFEGATVDLTDAGRLCASGRFCDPNGGIRDLIEKTDDPEVRRQALEMAGNCPGGRLVAWERGLGEAIEPDFRPSIGIIEDTAAGVRGPIRVMGGVPVVSADGEVYEVRNRMTLCRCGRSRNKPFCDSSHLGR